MKRNLKDIATSARFSLYRTKKKLLRKADLQKGASQPSLQVKYLCLFHGFPSSSSYHRNIQSDYVFLIFVAVSVVFAVVCVLNFFFQTVWAYLPSKIYCIHVHFLSYLVQPYIICYQPELWIPFLEVQKAFLGLADMYRNIPLFHMCTSNTILCGTWPAV